MIGGIFSGDGWQWGRICDPVHLYEMSISCQFRDYKALLVRSYVVSDIATVSQNFRFSLVSFDQLLWLQMVCAIFSSGPVDRVPGRRLLRLQWRIHRCEHIRLSGFAVPLQDRSHLQRCYNVSVDHTLAMSEKALGKDKLSPSDNVSDF